MAVMVLDGRAKQAATPRESAPAGGAGVVSAAVAAAEAAALLPKRKRAAQGPAGAIPRVGTMQAFAPNCNCRDTKACRGAAPAFPAGASSSGGGPRAAAAYCPYYEGASEQEGLQLYSFLDAPAVLRFNSYIRSGYRAGLSYPQCCRSMLQLHNETANIWTHALPALLLLALLAGGQLQAWQGARLAFLVNMGSIAACFLGSVLYHAFMGNHHHHDSWLRLDLCGVLLVLVSGGHMALWWGLCCHPTVQVTFAAMYYSAAAACVWATLTAGSAAQRGVPMLALLLIRLSAFLTRRLLDGGASEGLRHYMAMEVFSLAGGLLNVLRIPERFLQPSDPSKAAPLDYFFNSHQIMHVLVAAAMWQLHLGASADYRMISALQDGTAQCPVA